MENYSTNLLNKFVPPAPKTHQPSLYKHTKIQFGSKTQYTKETSYIPRLDDSGILCVQPIIGDILYDDQAVYKNLIVVLRKLRHQQASDTEATNKAI